MKKIIGLSLIMALVFSGSVFANGNYEESAETKQVAETNRQMNEMNSQVGMPVIDDFFEKKVAKWIFEARDNAELITYAYAFSDYHGKFVFISKCIGYGLPYSTQYTNPEKVITYRDNGTSYSGSSPSTIPQADPNGLYSPDGMSATWLLMIDPETDKPKPVYMEPTITVTPFPLDKRVCVGGINS